MALAAARPASEVDLQTIVDLAVTAAAQVRDQRGGERFLASLEPRATDPASLLRDLDDDRTMVWCGTFDDVVVGYAVARLVDDDAATIARVTELYIEPEVREVGVGEALMSAAIAWAIASGAAGIDAYALPGARETKNLFERLGLTARLITVHRDLR